MPVGFKVNSPTDAHVHSLEQFTYNLMLSAYTASKMKTFLIAAALAAVESRRLKTSATATAGKINVHIVPHTHDDVGWLKTPDQVCNHGMTRLQHQFA